VTEEVARRLVQIIGNLCGSSPIQPAAFAQARLPTHKSHTSP
jgi:hypothetical protein